MEIGIIPSRQENKKLFRLFFYSYNHVAWFAVILTPEGPVARGHPTDSLEGIVVPLTGQI